MWHRPIEIGDHLVTEMGGREHYRNDILTSENIFHIITRI